MKGGKKTPRSYISKYFNNYFFSKQLVVPIITFIDKIPKREGRQQSLYVHIYVETEQHKTGTEVITFLHIKKRKFATKLKTPN